MDLRSLSQICAVKLCGFCVERLVIISSKCNIKASDGREMEDGYAVLKVPL